MRTNACITETHISHPGEAVSAHHLFSSGCYKCPAIQHSPYRPPPACTHALPSPALTHHTSSLQTLPNATRMCCHSNTQAYTSSLQADFDFTGDVLGVSAAGTSVSVVTLAKTRVSRGTATRCLWFFWGICRLSMNYFVDCNGFDCLPLSNNEQSKVRACSSHSPIVSL